MSEMYQRMKERGVNMGWYEKGKHGRSTDAIPLDDDECSNLSIYLLKQDGTLWTVKRGDGSPHHQVRSTGKTLPRDVYVCLHCKKQWAEIPEYHPAPQALEDGEEAAS